jgi:predicted dehydrogenase
MTSQRVRVAVLGAGIGRQHLRGYMGVEKAQVTAICDLDLSRAEALAAEFGANDARIFTDVNEFLASDCADAVSLCLPNFLHARVAEQCFEAGLDVLCEKPLAINAAEAIQIAEAAKKYDRICMIGQVLRFRDDVLALKERADELQIYYARAMARRVNGIPKWGGWFTQQKLAGGGPLIDTGVHMIDLAWWFAGCPAPVSASATNYAAFGKEKLHLGKGGAANENGIFDVEDLAAGLVRFQNGLSIHFEASWAINAESDSRYCHLHGKNGAIIWNDNPKLIAADGAVSDMPNDAGNSFQKEMEHFVDCVLNRQTPDPDVTQGVTMMKILDALYESARIGREVEIV